MPIPFIEGLLDDVAQGWKQAAGIARNKNQMVSRPQQRLGFTDIAGQDLARFSQQPRGIGGTTFKPNLASFPYAAPQLRSLMGGAPVGKFTYGAPRFGMQYASPNSSIYGTSSKTDTYGPPADTGGYVPDGDASGARGLDGTRRWQSMIEKAAKEAGIPWQVISAIMGIESGGDPNSVSVAGATGLMQIMPDIWGDTAARFGGNLNDPWTNIRTGAEILKIFKEQYGDWGTAANAYLGFGPADAYGTTGEMYKKLFNNNLVALGWGGDGGQGVQSNGKPVFPVQGYTGDVDLHWGEDPGAADIFADYGTPVLAINGGTATSGYSDIGGYWTMIIGDDGLQYYYAHMDKMGPNGRINAGDYIAGVSDTGNAKGTGPHLHLGIGTHIKSGTGPQGGAGDINVREFLAGTWRGGAGSPGMTAGAGTTSGTQTRSQRYGYNF